MKTLTLTLLSSLALVASSQAGEYTAAPLSEDTTSHAFFNNGYIGGSVGYLSEFDDAMYTLHFGEEIYSSDRSSHSLFLEVGYATDDFKEFGINVDVEMIPVTFNYKFELAIANRLNWYVGGGVGAAYIEASAGSISDSETYFLGQVFTGLEFDITESFEVFGGVRYMYIRDTKFKDFDSDSFEDSAFFELGLRYNF